MPDLDPEEETNSENESPELEKPGRSTGPRSQAGKNRSSRNAVRHGCCSNSLILEGESPEEFRQLRDSWMYDYNPTSSVLTDLVLQVVIAQWLLIRKRGRYNQNEHRIEKEESNCLNWTEEHHKDMERFGRYLRQAERQFTNALSNLERVRGRVFREGMQLQKAQERAAAIEVKRAAVEAERQKSEAPPQPNPLANPFSRAEQPQEETPNPGAIDQSDHRGRQNRHAPLPIQQKPDRARQNAAAEPGAGLPPAQLPTRSSTRI